jgi:hypothetical protein
MKTKTTTVKVKLPEFQTRTTAPNQEVILLLNEIAKRQNEMLTAYRGAAWSKSKHRHILICESSMLLLLIPVVLARWLSHHFGGDSLQSGQG